MARTALWGPAHRVMARMPTGSGTATPSEAAPSLDMGGSGIQDSRLRWNTANSSTGAQVVGWMGGGSPVLDFVPATLTLTAIAASQVPLAGTALTLVSTTGAGVTVSAAALLALPSLVTIPSGTLFLDSVPTYHRFGTLDYTVFYNAATMGSRNIQIASGADDSAATVTVVGWDIYGYVMRETITLSNAGTAVGSKAFKAIASVTPAGTLSGTAITVGQGDKFGLPLFALSTVTSITGFWNSLIITGAGTVTSGVTTAATATSGDVRGTYLVGSASNNTKRLIVYQRPVLSNMVTNGINAGLFGVAQF